MTRLRVLSELSQSCKRVGQPLRRLDVNANTAVLSGSSPLFSPQSGQQFLALNSLATGAALEKLGVEEHRSLQASW
jgi:hypothetical protein